MCIQFRKKNMNIDIHTFYIKNNYVYYYNYILFLKITCKRKILKLFLINRHVIDFLTFTRNKFTVLLVNFRKKCYISIDYKSTNKEKF